MPSFDNPVIASAALCIAMLLCSTLGFAVGGRHQAGAARGDQFGVVEAAVLALLGLLLGFTLQSAMTRLSEARQTMVQEVNAIGTAYLRVDLLPNSDQAEMRKLFRTYLEARLRVYDTVASGGNAERPIAEARQWQEAIWKKGVDASRAQPSPTALLMLPALNEMIDITTARQVAFRTKVPALVVSLLFTVAIVSALLIGYALATQKRHNPVPAVIFSIIISATVYTLLDLDSPQLGLIRLEAAEQALRGLHDSIR